LSPCHSGAPQNGEPGNAARLLATSQIPGDTLMQRDVPPYRADHVGSLLRPQRLKHARLKRAAGELSADELKTIEDDEIKVIIAKQEELGLHAITDGELRRAYWHFDFFCGLDGVELIEVSQGIQFTGVQSKAEAPYVKRKLGAKKHPQIAH